MPLTESNSFNYKYNDAVICPHCDYKMDAILDKSIYAAGLFKSGDHKINCSKCKKVIKVTTARIPSFSTSI